ncbi:MAG TPA: sugar-binding transcriptional regulator [Trueperaceae bacterium]
MHNNDKHTFEDALKVARMYYHLDYTTEQIAGQLGVSRPTVSRLLSWAKAHGLVEFRIVDHHEHQLDLESRLETHFGIAEVKVVPILPSAGESERLQAVTRFAAHYLGGLMQLETILSVAWGNTVAELARRLIPKPLPGVQVVQMSGSGNSGSGITYAADIVTAFAGNYAAVSHLMPIPAYFDDPATKEAMFRERSVARIRKLALTADIALFSIGVPNADSYIYRAGYLEKAELDRLQGEGVVGDIGTMFFRADGSADHLAINERSSGPDLASLARHKHSICIVAGEKKRRAVLGALHGGFMNTLIIDEPTARSLLQSAPAA